MERILHKHGHFDHILEKQCKPNACFETFKVFSELVYHTY